jgi:hypothetical protein
MKTLLTNVVKALPLCGEKAKSCGERAFGHSTKNNKRY